MIKITSSGLADVEAMLERVGPTGLRAAHKQLRVEAGDLKAIGQMLTPFREGKLSGNIHIKDATISGTDVSLIVGTSGIPYAAVMHWTPPPGRARIRKMKRKLKSGKVVVQTIKGYRHKAPTTSRFLWRAARMIAKELANRMEKVVFDAIDREV